MDFLARIAPPVVSQPQAFTDAMLDPISRGLWGGLNTEHTSGASLQATIRHSADQLYRSVQGQFVSLKVSNNRPCLNQGGTIAFIYLSSLTPTPPPTPSAPRHPLGVISPNFQRVYV